MTSEPLPPRKAVIAVGFTPGGAANEAAQSLPSSILAGRLPAAEQQMIRQAVEAVLAAGLSELIFVTREGAAVAEAPAQTGDDSLARPVVVARRSTAATLGEALCGLRGLIGAEPFVVVTPQDNAPSVTAKRAVARLLDAYCREGGNLVTVSDTDALRRHGTFAAIEVAPGGHYLLQPDVLGALQVNPQGGLAAALLAQAEAWPVTALPLDRGRIAAPRGAGGMAAAEAAE